MLEATTFEEHVHLALNLPCSCHSLVNRLWDKHSNTPRFLIGRNTEAKNLLKQFHFDGLIDDYANPGLKWEGLSVYKMIDVPPDSLVMNCVTSIAPVNVEIALRKAGLTHIVSIADLISSHTWNEQEWPAFVRTQRDDYKKHHQIWKNLFDQLQDPESKQTLLDVLRFRLTADARYMQNYQVRLTEQYFENFLNLSDEVFVDAGGFDGDTTEQFCLRAPNYKRVYFFEPSEKNLAAARKRLASWPKIEFRALGLSDQEGELCFNAESGSACSISEEGTEKITVTTLDQNVQEPVSLIKMDLEGWEPYALNGCKQQIIRNTPKLAIAVYHHAAHFRDVFNYVLDLQPAYHVRLRHYTQGWSETVMFFTRE
jgi:FkbM family methyltransferase